MYCNVNFKDGVIVLIFYWLVLNYVVLSLFLIFSVCCSVIDGYE